MRKSSNPNPPANEQNSPALDELAQDVLYQPSPKERASKARFWQRSAQHPLIEAQKVSYEQARSIMGNESLRASWSKPGFREWFLNADERRERLEQLFDSALDAAEEILINTDPKAQSARVNMIRLIADLAGKMPGKGNPAAQLMKGAVDSMDKVQLEAFLQRSGIQMQLSASKGEVTLPKDSAVITVKTIDNQE